MIQSINEGIIDKADFHARVMVLPMVRSGFLTLKPYMVVRRKNNPKERQKNTKTSPCDRKIPRTRIAKIRICFRFISSRFLIQYAKARKKNIAAILKE